LRAAECGIDRHAGTSYMARLTSIKFALVDGPGARLSVTVIPADVTDPASGRHRLG